MEEFDLDSYLARIGFAGPRSATLDALRILHRLHPSAIAFENLDPLMGRAVPIDVVSIASKLVGRKRGGYCYEHNTLFQAALRAFGFSVTSHAARVQWHLPPGAIPPRYHMVLRISLPEGDYLADVGFGRLTLTAPLRLSTGEQQTPHGLYRLIEIGPEYQMQAKLGGRWEPIYQLSLQEQAATDWEVANWFTSTNPSSIFTRSLMAARSAEDQVFGLFNGELSVYGRDGQVERRTIRDADELAEVLQGPLRINVPAEYRPALERAIESAKR